MPSSGPTGTEVPEALLGTKLEAGIPTQIPTRWSRLEIKRGLQVDAAIC